MEFISLFQKRKKKSEEEKNSFNKLFVSDEGDIDEEGNLGNMLMAFRKNRTLGSSLDNLYTKQEIIELIRKRKEENLNPQQCTICRKLVNPIYKIICDDGGKTPKILEKGSFCRRHRREVIAPLFDIKVKY
jgi:hypothetical protein